MIVTTKLEYKYTAGSTYIRIIEPENPEKYVWLRLGSLRYAIQYINKNEYMFTKGTPSRHIYTFEDIELESDKDDVVDTVEWISRSRTEYQDYTIKYQVDYSRYEDESWTSGGVRGEIRITWEEKFVNGSPTGEKRNERRETIRQMQPLIRWTGGKKRPVEPPPTPPTPPPTPTPAGKIRWYRHKIIYDDGKIVYGKPWRDGKDGRDGSDADNAEVIRKFESYKEQTDKRFLQTVTQTQLDTVTGEFNKSISRVEQKSDSITSTVQSLSTKLDNKPSLYEVSSMINQKSDEISTSVSRKVTADISSDLQSLSNRIDSKPSYYDVESSISQKADSITSTVTQKVSASIEGELSDLSKKIDGKPSYYDVESSISQKADSITSTVTQKVTDSMASDLKNLSDKINSKPSYYDIESSINQKADSITSTVTKTVSANIDTKLSDLSRKIDGKPSYYTIESMISQKVDNITIGIKEVDGLNYELSKFSSRISALQDKIEIQAKNIDLSGYVKFSDLREKGSYTTINGSLIKTGKISSSSGDSWIDLNNGNFSFFKKSLFIDENVYDPNSRSNRTRLHTKGTFRVSYGDNPSVELNSGGITLFKEGQSQSSRGTNKIQSNGSGNLQMGSIDGYGSTSVNVEIGSKNGYVMYVYGSLYVGRNLMVDQAIRYGATCQKGTTF